MYRKSFIRFLGVRLFFYLLSSRSVVAQFSLTGQVPIPSEVRNGFGNFVLTVSKSAVFISQRARLYLGYTWSRIMFGISIQDIRQDAPSISRPGANRLMLHEGRAKPLLANKSDTTFKFNVFNDSVPAQRRISNRIYGMIRFVPFLFQTNTTTARR